MFVAQYVPLQLEFNLLDSFSAVVGDMYVDVDAGPADPNLSVESSRHSYDIERGFTGLDPLIGGSEGTREGHEGLLSCSLVSCILQ